jgi:hypothetical protein
MYFFLASVSGVTRNELLHSYRKWKGLLHVPSDMPRELKWKSAAEFTVSPNRPLKWSVIEEKKGSNVLKNRTKRAPVVSTVLDHGFVPAPGLTPLKQPLLDQDIMITPVGNKHR